MLSLRITPRCCATPKPDQPAFRLPKRLERIRRVSESKRLDSLKAFHEALKKTAKDEHAFVKDFFSKTQDMWNDITEASAEDEENAEKEEE